VSSTITVQLDALDELAGELTALAGELAADGDRCSAAGTTLFTALAQDACLDAVWAAHLWAALARSVADATRAVAAALAAAVLTYRAAEAARAQAIARRPREFVAVAW
jgi:hypothetical protein